MNSSNSINFQTGWDELSFEEKRAAKILSSPALQDEGQTPDIERITKSLGRGHDISVQLVNSLTQKGFLPQTDEQ